MKTNPCSGRLETTNINRYIHYGYHIYITPHPHKLKVGTSTYPCMDTRHYMYKTAVYENRLFSCHYMVFKCS